MKITLRLILALVIAILIVGGLSAYLGVRSEKERLASELKRNAWLVAEGLKDTAGKLVAKGPTSKADKIIKKMSETGERVLGVAAYGPSGKPVYASKAIKSKLPEKLNIVFEKFTKDAGKGAYENVGGIDTYLYAVPLYGEEGIRSGTLVIFSDASYIQKYLRSIWQQNFIRVFSLALLVSLITVLVVRWSFVGPVARLAERMKEMRKGEAKEDDFKLPKEDLFGPLSKEISNMAKSLATARARAEEEARLRQKAESVWTKDRLKEHVRTKLDDKKLIVVSNREPYLHRMRGKQIECIRPASGLITALEPILRVSGGLWLATGAGDADKETVNEHNVIRVPPEDPQYDLKRVWLSQEEEEGFYFGFSNEGLWPLCHIAHTRPIFRMEDWNQYQEVNFKFAKSLDEEIQKGSYIFIQDYHFALLPRIIKNKHPDAKVGIFWHIPWPNPEAFGICPWRREIIHGLLGADIIGFHTQFHCNNFLETVDRTLECRIDWEHFSTIRMGHTTYVKPFPISIEFPPVSYESSKNITKEELLKNLGVHAEIMGVGVDRLDYTKGIVERFRAIERFLDKYPDYVGKLTFVQIGSPSREQIGRYQELIHEVTAESDRINWKFEKSGWKPIIFMKRYFSHEEIDPYYKLADFCMVTSLHDGMNLVAKEYVASRDNDNGVLILSTFTGASKEFSDALLINPYDVEQMADIIKKAVDMDAAEQELRMRNLRNVVRDNNIFKWAADIITELTQIREPTVS